MANPNSVPESLEKEVDHTILEARMVLPGVQTLFGFQLVAVFNERFEKSLSPLCQYVHLAALVLIAIAIALIMAPAAYHRQVESGVVSRYFAQYASRLIAAALIPLLIAIALDVALVAWIISANALLCVTLSLLVASFFAWFWFAVPRIHRHRHPRRQ
jgi:hypothetical protein